MTYTISAMVTLVSATFVATTTFLRFVFAKTCFCSALERFACKGKMSTFRTLCRRASIQDLISPTPGKLKSKSQQNKPCEERDCTYNIKTPSSGFCEVASMWATSAAIKS